MYSGSDHRANHRVQAGRVAARYDSVFFVGEHIRADAARNGRRKPPGLFTWQNFQLLPSEISVRAANDCASAMMTEKLKIKIS